MLQNNKVRRFAFELKMQDKSTYLLAADSEGEMEDWINTLNKILHSSFEIAMQEKRNGDSHEGGYARRIYTGNCSFIVLLGCFMSYKSRIFISLGILSFMSIASFTQN